MIESGLTGDYVRLWQRELDTPSVFFYKHTCLKPRPEYRANNTDSDKILGGLQDRLGLSRGRLVVWKRKM